MSQYVSGQGVVGGSIYSEELKAFYHLLWYSCFGWRMGMGTQ